MHLIRVLVYMITRTGIPSLTVFRTIPGRKERIPRYRQRAINSGWKEGRRRFSGTLPTSVSVTEDYTIFACQRGIPAISRASTIRTKTRSESWPPCRTCLSRVSLYLYETDQQQHEREVAWTCKQALCF